MTNPKGATFERFVADYLSKETGIDIDRRVKHGRFDTGDIQGCYINGERVVIECKNHKKMMLGEWIDEAKAEAHNDGASWYFVVHKRRGCGDKRAGDNYVTMPLSQLAELLGGGNVS